jgi:penicillin-binding protein 1C
MIHWAKRNYRILLGTTLFVAVIYYFCLPENLFRDPYSTVLEASTGELLSATIAKDGQWRFPESDSVPSKFAVALITFEDKRFYSHPGVDILSLARAFRQNIKSGKIVSGGSTISMQVIRLSRKGKSRTIVEKAIEVVLASRLELRCSKEEILALYASHAPFGGNVVGLEAACWRYFRLSPENLSWAEASLLAVLPNSPSLIHPGKNREQLKRKRDRLLDKLQASGKIDAFTCSLAKEEPIPEQPQPLPRYARHLLLRAQNDRRSDEKIHSTINYILQSQVEQIVQHHHEGLKDNFVNNAAAIVLDVKSGHVLAYVGNILSGEKDSGEDVDIISSSRSTGSILKPFLYAACLDNGKILPKTLLPDIPVIVNGFSPKNFSHDYDGAVPADKALIRSLNIPAVHILKDYNVEKFHQLLKKIGFTTFSKSTEHYGLSLILGGGESTLWEITGAYASMARTLTNDFIDEGDHRYDKSDFHPPAYVNEGQLAKQPDATSWLNAGAIYLTFDAIKELYRPGEETGWRHFSSSRQIAWKTGTSFGFRDGWAVGVTPEFAVGVWVGNADGEGRPGLTGTDAAAPIMFDIFSKLPGSKWFHQPFLELSQITTCKKSGYRISERCPEADTLWVTKKGLETNACSLHKTVHVTHDQKFRVHSQCASVDAITHINWFVLPPVQEFYYKAKNISYRSLPPFRKDCSPTSGMAGMEMIYPKPNATIFIPREIDGTPGSSVFQLAHRNPGAEVYWHLDGEYLGSTRRSHHFPIQASEGKHTIVIIDQQGEAIERQFEVVTKM